MSVRYCAGGIPRCMDYCNGDGWSAVVVLGLYTIRNWLRCWRFAMSATARIATTYWWRARTVSAGGHGLPTRRLFYLGCLSLDVILEVDMVGTRYPAPRAIRNALLHAPGLGAACLRAGHESHDTR